MKANISVILLLGSGYLFDEVFCALTYWVPRRGWEVTCCIWRGITVLFPLKLKTQINYSKFVHLRTSSVQQVLWISWFNYVNSMTLILIWFQAWPLVQDLNIQRQNNGTFLEKAKKWQAGFQEKRNTVNRGAVSGSELKRFQNQTTFWFPRV